MPPSGLLKLCPLDSRHRQPIRIVLLYVCWRVIGDKFNLEALTVNQVKSFKALVRIINKPWDEINLFDSNKKMCQNDINSCRTWMTVVLCYRSVFDPLSLRAFCSS
jgi:hypothetical protein